VGTFGLSGPDAAAGGGIVTTGIGALVFGLVAAAAAIGLWRGRTWAWLAGFVIGLLGLVGCLVAGATSGFESPLVVGALISLGTVVCLALPGARRGSSLY
jgi:hypothetical protein